MIAAGDRRDPSVAVAVAVVEIGNRFGARVSCRDMSNRFMRRAAAISLYLPVFAATAHGAAITVSSDTVQRQHQEEATLCVGLVLRSNEQIAGTENELVWDEDCATLLDGSCAEDSGHGKQLSGTLQKQRGAYKALLLSFSDTDPMPAGTLYCCNFLVHAEPGSCCRVRVTNPGGSDPEGNSMPVQAGPPGQLCVASDGRGVGGSGGLGGGSLGGGTGSIGGGSDFGGDTGNLGGGTGNPGGGGSGAVGGEGPASGGGNTVLPGGGGNTVLPGGDAQASAGSGGAAGGSETGGSAAAGGAPAAAPAENAPQAGVNATGEMAGQGPGQGQVAPAQGAVPPPAAGPNAASEVQAPVVAPGGAATPRVAEGVAPTPAATAPSEPTPAAATAAAEEPTNEPAAPAVGNEAAPEAEKPSPRDVAPAAEQGAAARPRRMPLDEDESWFGCQTTAAGASAWPALAPLLLLLARRRRRI